MGLEHVGYVDLPPHAKPGGFDHAAVLSRRGLLYVAHTANDAVDVIDCTSNTYLRSIPDLTGVAGALVSEAHDLVFTSNRGENTIGIFSPSGQEAVAKVKVGVGPNGLAYGADQRLLLAANVGDPSRRGSFTVSLVDVSTRAVIATIPELAGRGGPSSTPRAGGSTSTSPIHRRSLWSTAPTLRGSQTRFRCRRWDRTGWISIRRHGVSSARATARCCSWWTRGPAPC